MAQDSELYKSVEGRDVCPSIPETARRFVCFLDIMGFKDMVARQNGTEIRTKLKNLSSFIDDKTDNKNGFAFSMFSDSIILFSKDDSESDFREIIAMVSDVLEEAIKNGIPIKGALACGECTVSLGQKPFYFGQPIIDAYQLEENVVMYGVALHNSVEELAEKSAAVSKIVFDYLLPLKGGKSSHYVVNWFESNNHLAQNKENLKSIRKTVSDAPRRYIDNTLECIAFLEH
jgi:hypothetical protein